MRWAAPVLVVILTAGCLSASPHASPQAAPSSELGDPIIEQHDHNDPSLHNLSTPNLELLGHNSLGENATAARGQYGELDIQGDLAFVGVTGDGGEMPGFLVVSIADRTHPKVLSFTPAPLTRVTDVKGDPSGHFAFVAGETGLQPYPQDALTGDPNSATMENGVRAFDVSDPAKPTLVAFGRSDSGCHMLAYKKYAGGEWLFCVGTGVYIYAWDPAAHSITLASRYQGVDPAAAATTYYTTHAPSYAWQWQTAPHDITLTDDAASGKILMSVAQWSEGVRLVDVTDPRTPIELSSWTGQGAKDYLGYMHSATTVTTSDGRRLVYATPEIYEGPAVPVVFVLDATDLTHLKYAGEWMAPGHHPNEDIRFSTHNFQIVDGRLYLAYYHAGVWVLDVSGANATAPSALGYYLPHENTTIVGKDASGVPDVWDVNLKDGYLYALDIPTGLYVLHYKPDRIGDPALTSHT